MMKKIIQASLLLFLICFASVAQKQGLAVLVSANENSGFNSIIIDDFKAFKRLNSNQEMFYYDWEEGKKLTPVGNDGTNPVDKLMFVELYSEVESRPRLQLVTDSTGKTVSAFYPIRPELNLKLKIVDLKSTEILFLTQFSLNTSSDELVASNRGSGRFDVSINFKESFSADPSFMRLNNKGFEEAERKAYEKYKQKIHENKVAAFKEFSSYCVRRFYYAQEVLIDKYFTIKKDGIVEDKVKFVKSDLSLKDGYSTSDYIDFYEIQKFGEHVSYDKGYTFKVESIDSTGSELKLAMFGNQKRLAELILNDAQVLITNNESVLNNKVREIGNEEIQTVAVKKNCINCFMNLESNLAAVPSIRVLERADFEFRHFRELLKSEKNIDNFSNDDYYKMLGVRYLFSIEDDKLTSTDIETGRIIGTESKEGKILGFKFSASTSPVVIKTMFLNTFDKEMEIFEYTNVKKKTVKEVRVYNPFGVILGERVLIYKQQEETVGGKKLSRNILIGEGYIRSVVNKHLANLYVQKGNKELLEMKNSGAKVVLEYKL
ncbi:hypothetical protein [uncultured Arcticibacterium sp.]|uniref:hypothetical protein n=1 Tax=uncultured Arcticibacterium sp. TaxID=2173042 RepID=UPI0030FC58CB